MLHNTLFFFCFVTNQTNQLCYYILKDYDHIEVEEKKSCKIAEILCIQYLFFF